MPYVVGFYAFWIGVGVFVFTFLALELLDYLEDRDAEREVRCWRDDIERAYGQR